MPVRGGQDTFLPSEDSYMPQELDLFDQLDLDDWCHTESHSLPLTPPDTEPDCATPDSLDMDPSRWTHTYVPQEYSPGLLAGSGSFDQSDLDAFISYNARRGQVDAGPAWTNHRSGFVDTDMSPSLSYTSQSSRSLNTLPDSENAWTSLASNQSSSPMVRNPSGLSVDMSYQPLPIGYMRGHTVMPMDNHPRAIDFHKSPAPDAAVRVARPGPMMMMPHGLSQSAATARYQPHARRPQSGPTNVAYLPSANVPGLRTMGIVSRNGPPMLMASSPITRHAQSRAGSRQQPQAPIFDPVAEDFSNLIDFPAEDSYAGSMPSMSSYGPSLPLSLDQPWPIASTAANLMTPVARQYIEPLPLDVVPSQTRVASRRPVPVNPNGPDLEEGRYRTDPLYSRRAGPNGLYHCPFYPNESCGHRPTKLKCNYDKFIDSHLKPFRCKSPECVRQAFSSTACLLRHEREAHGMHGHGHCPHLCPVPGCERGERGKGFPRLYNCKDHMKRAHGIAPPSPAPVLVATSSSTHHSSKASARKRKASPQEKILPRRHKHDSTPARPASDYPTSGHGGLYLVESDSRRTPGRRG